MKGLLLVAHGSRREASNDEVRELTRMLKEKASDFSEVECAFLELAKPSIPDGLKAMIAANLNPITVLPYFLSAGRHVSEDIPAEIKSVQDKYPDTEIVLTSYLGASPAIIGTLLELSKR